MPQDTTQLPLSFLTSADLYDLWQREAERTLAETPCTCTTCGVVRRHENGEDVDGDFYCAQCVIHCAHCDMAYADGDERIGRAMNSRDPSMPAYLCDDCSFVCADCEGRFFSSDCRYENDNGAQVCSDCGANYFCCDGCNSTVADSEAHSDDSGTYCEACWSEREVRHIHPYSYKPTPQFFRAVNQKVACVAFGVEIEVEGSHDDHDDAIEAVGLGDDPAFYCKEDGSLNNGFEIVSHPLTWEYWAEHNLSFLRKLKRKGYTSYNTDTCGMHVHVSRKYLTDAEMVKLLTFFKGNQAFIRAVSRRGRGGGLSRWAKLSTGTVREHIRLVTDVADDRYCAINLCNAKTIEFRIFQGTLGVRGVRRNLAFVYTLCAFIKHAGLKQLTKSGYMTWVRENASKVLGRRNNTAFELVQWLETR